MAHALKELGVDIIEAGFPIASPGDFEAVQMIAREVHGPGHLRPGTLQHGRHRPRLGGLAGCPRPRIHVFLATSPIHRQFKLHMEKDEMLRRRSQAWKGPGSTARTSSFRRKMPRRTELDFLVEVVTRVVAAGATTLNIPDTVGYAVPEQYAEIMRHLKQNVPGIDKVILTAHCHDDLGMAVANSLAAVHGGARQVECTINGLGERAGNCALEEVVMAVKTRQDYFS